MTGLELKILFKNSKAYLTENKSIKIQEDSLNQNVKKFESFAYWEIRVINYVEEENRLFCEVLSYNLGKSEFESNQKKLAYRLDQIENISFNKINTSGLLSTILKTNRNLKPIYKEHKSKVENLSTKSVINHINETFYMPIKRVNFNVGYVSFEKKFQEYPKSIELKIINHDIRKEFDSIKNYFSNVLNTKKIQVRVDIYIENNEILFLNINSPEIDKINKELIDEVKFDFIKSIVKKKNNLETENVLFTIEEYFETLTDDDFELKAFYPNDKVFLEYFLKVSNSKHYKHLRFLSSKHSHDIMKLRFIHNPFSFIFLLKGVEYYHFVWETLNTKEATYVWHISKKIDTLKTYLGKIEESIKVMKINGKLEYISNTEDKFNRICHDYSNSINGFIKWKEELEKILI